MNSSSTLLPIVIVFAFVPRVAAAAEGYGNCTGFVDSLPAIIKAEGTWCLRKNLSTAIGSGNAISIDADNVTIDCNDFKIGGSAAGLGTTAFGIHTGDRRNTTVRNCSIRGFATGLAVVGGGGHVVENNRLDRNTSVGISFSGGGVIVRRNQVFDTG